MKIALLIARVALAGFFALLPAAGVGGGLALAPLSGAAGVAGFRPSALMAGFGRHRIALILLAAFVAWAAVSSAWSPWPDHREALRLTATAISGLLFMSAASADADRRRLTEAAGLAAFLVLMGLLAVELFLNLPLNRATQHEDRLWVLQRNPGRGVSVLVVLGWAVLAGLLARGGLIRVAVSLLLAGLIAALSTQFGMEANMAAFAVGLVAFGLAYAAPRFGIFATFGVVSAWALAAPFATPLLVSDQHLVDKLPQSWAIRTEVWKFVAARIREQPWIGHGLDASRSFGAYKINVRGLITHAIPLHPHSASLQIWLETGAVGAVLAVLALMSGAFALARGLRNQRAAAAAACATLASFGVIANVSFGAWQEWWVATAFIAAGMIAAIAATSARA